MKLLPFRPGNTADVDERQLRAARLVAVRQTRWTELEQPHLVARGPRNSWLVHEPSDAVYVVKRGSVFANGRAIVEFVAPERMSARRRSSRRPPSTFAPSTM